MQRRILSLVAAMAILVSLCTGIVPVVKADDALPSYNFSYYYEADNMGVLEHLKYYARDVVNNTYTELEYRQSDGTFICATGNYTNGTWFSTGANPAIETAVFFTAPYSGKITITNAAEDGNMVNRGVGWSGNQGTAYARIWDNAYQEIAYYDIPASDTPVPTPAIEDISVEAGDQIKFIVGSTTGKNDYIQWIPVITYTSIDKEPELPSYNFSYYYEADNMGVLEHLKHYARDVANNTYTELEYRQSDGLFLGGTGNYTNGAWISTGANPAIETAVFFTAPYSGRITITNAAENGNMVNRGVGWTGNQGTAYARIWDNDNQVLAYYDIPASDTPVPTPAIENIYVEAGDQIKFIVGSTTGKNDYIQWVPVITYTSIGEEQVLPSYNFSYFYEENNMGVLEHLKHYARDVVNNTYTELEYRQSDGMFICDTGNYTNGTWLSTGSNPAIETAVFFTAPYSGRITITNAAENGNIVNRGVGWSGNQGTAYARIWDNDNQQIAYYDIPASDTPVPTPAIENIYVEAGDQIKFIVGSTTGKNDYIQWVPVVTYTEIHEHTWQESWQSDETHHWHNCTDSCGVTDITKKDGYGAHVDTNYDARCDFCGYKMPISSELPSYNFSYYYEENNMGVLEHLKHYVRDVVNNTYTELEYRQSDGMFLCDTGNYTNGSWLSTGENPSFETVVFFTAPYDGIINIGNAAENGNIVNRGRGWDRANFASAYASIVGDDATQLAYYEIPADETPVATPVLTGIEVKAGDQIKFIVGSNSAMNCYIQWVPVIVYTSADMSHIHQWQEAWKSDDTYHWHDCTDSCTITDNAKKYGYGLHIDGDRDEKCDACGYEMPILGPEDGVYSIVDMFSKEQTGVWHYLTREVVTNVYKKMTWNGSEWTDGMGGLITKDFIHASADASDTHEIQVCLEFVAPYDGVISLSMLGGAIKVGAGSDNGVRIAIWNNNDPIMGYTDLNPGQVYDFAPTEVSVDKGDCIRFLVTAISGNNAGDSVTMSPIITYKSIKYRLGPDQGVYSILDMFSGKQTDIWHYLARESVSNTYKELTWDGKQWIDGMGGIIANEFMHASADGSDKHEIQICLEFVAPSDGVIKIAMEDDVIGVSADSRNGVRVGIMQNNTLIYNYTDLAGGRNHSFEPITVNVTKGDCIRFLLCPISGNNEGDGVTYLPIISYLSYEKAPEPEVEDRPDDPSRTYYNASEDYGGYTNPWYYAYCAFGSQKLNYMTWQSQSNNWLALDYAGLSITATGAHPYPGLDAVRVYRAPKSGTIRLSMDSDIMTMSNGTTGAEDGVFFMIRMNDGASISDVYKKTLILPGEEMSFDSIELKIYKGWELWFVVNCNTNNANDFLNFIPIIEYLEITDEEAPVYSNRDEDVHALSLDLLNPDTSMNHENKANINIWLIVAAFAVTAVIVNTVIVILMNKRRKKK